MSSRSKKKHRYDDEDEISKSIAEFQGASNEEEDEEEDNEENVIGVDPGAPEGDETVYSSKEEDKPFGIMGRHNAGIVGRQIVDDGKLDEDNSDLDIIDADAPKTRAPKEINIPVCACCGAKWSVVDGMIRNGCGCRIHPTCEQCGKCAGHCQCRSGVAADVK